MSIKKLEGALSELAQELKRLYDKTRKKPDMPPEADRTWNMDGSLNTGRSASLPVSLETESNFDRIKREIKELRDKVKARAMNKEWQPETDGRSDNGRSMNTFKAERNMDRIKREVRELRDILTMKNSRKGKNE